MKILIAITTCAEFSERAKAQRETWVPEVQGADVEFFVGRPAMSVKTGECWYRDDANNVVLNCPDGYHFLSEKTQLIRQWARQHGYDFLWKIDDDCYVRPERLLPLSGPDYIGRLRGPSGNYRAPYCSGFAYGLSAKAMDYLNTIQWQRTDDFSEDRWTGNRLLEAGITPHHDARLNVVWSKKNMVCNREAPLANNDVIVACEYSPDKMRSVHADFKNGVPSKETPYRFPSGTLNRVAVMIKTFMRDGYLFACLDGLERTMPDAKIIVVDDGHEHPDKIKRYAALRKQGHAAQWMPFDSGFGAKANMAILACDKEYILIGSDDFDFSQPGVREGVERMVKVLDATPSLALVSGRVDNRPYEFVWDVTPGCLREQRRTHGSGEVDGIKFHMVDLTVNYSLIRRKVFEPAHGSIRWDGGDVKIGGGEHSAFFIDLQRTYWGVAYVEGANINQFKSNPHWQEKDYPAMRARARVPGRPCLKARGVDKYILADGTVEIS